MTSLRIALVLLEAPLPFGDASARWFYVLLRGLVARGHRVTAFAASSRPGEIERARALFPAPDYDLRLFPFPARSGWRAKWATALRPFSYMLGPDLIRELEAVVAEGVDLLHLEQVWSGWAGLAHADRALISVHYLSAIDLAEVHPKSLRERWQRRLIIATERRLIRKFRHFRALSSRLEDSLRAIHPRGEITTVPLGLDTTLYPMIPDERRSRTPTVTLIGSMGWQPSYSAAIRLLTRLWPEIKRRVPDARLEIVGWSARAKLAGFLDRPDVTIVENVPEIQPYFERASVLLYAPSRGSGMKVKIQEAMAFGVPVVTTSEGIEGLSALDGVHVGLSDDDVGLIDRTVMLLNDPNRQDRQRHAARALLDAECGPGPTLDGIEAIYARMTGGPESIPGVEE